jgi:hypothetical protein
MKESKFQHDLIKKIKDRFPGSIVLKNDANYIQGIPDLTVLYKDNWATLECKNSSKASHRPNQDYYVGKMNEMSFSAFIDPSCEEEVLNGMAQSFKRHDTRGSCGTESE